MNFQQLPDLIAFYSIRPKAGLSLGTRLENFVDIYFDFNDPVRTNTTVNTLWQPTYTPGGVDTVFVTANQKSISEKAFSIYPNPSKGGMLYSDAAEEGNLRIYNQLGVLEFSGKITTGRNSLNLSNLPKGIHFVHCETLSHMGAKTLILK